MTPQFGWWQSLGNLRNGGNAGLWYVNGNNGLTNANWNIGSRQSGQPFNVRRDYRTPPLVAMWPASLH